MSRLPLLAVLSAVAIAGWALFVRQPTPTGPRPASPTGDITGAGQHAGENVAGTLEPAGRTPVPQDQDDDEVAASGDGDAVESDDPWARYWVEPGTEIDDPRRLRCANLAISRAEFLNSLEGPDQVEIHRKAKILAAHSIAAILESNGQYLELGEGPKPKHPDMDGEGYVMQLNNRSYRITRGDFPVYDTLRDARWSAARPAKAPRDWVSPGLAPLTEQNVTDVLSLAEEALAWVAD